MIIGKTIYRWAAMLLLCVLLVSCEGTDGQELPLELLEQELPAPDSEEETPDAYCVIVSSDCSAELWDTAQALADAIADRTGVKTERIYEHEESFLKEGAFFIYLGWVRSSPEANGWIRRLKRDDYLCRRTENAMVIGGKTDAATHAAVDRFCQELLPAAEASALMHPDGGFTYLSDGYAVDTVKLNGFDLHEYCVVYPSDASDSIRTLAQDLRYEIAERSGYLLETLPEDRFDSVGKGIFIGTEEPLQTGDSAHWIPKDNGVLLTAWSFFGISVATERFCSRLFADAASGACSLDVPVEQSFLYVNGAYRLFNAALEGLLPFDTPNEIIQITDLITFEQPHAIFCGTVPTDQAKYLTQSLSGYTLIERAMNGTDPLTAYDKDGALSFLEARSIEGTDLLVSSFWMGDEWNGFGVLQISGTLTEDGVLRLSELCAKLQGEPAVILVHILSEGGELSFEDTENVHAVLSETYTVADDSYIFACYATAEHMNVHVENGGQASVHRFVTVERTSAF